MSDYYRYRGKKFLTYTALLEIHDKVIERSGGSVGIKSKGAVEGVSLKPKTSAGGEDAYPTFFTKVAALGYEIATGHNFTDGNKRTALTAMLWTLNANGYKAKPSADAASTVMLLIATKHLDIPGIRIALIHWCGLEIADHSL